MQSWLVPLTLLLGACSSGVTPGSGSTPRGAGGSSNAAAATTTGAGAAASETSSTASSSTGAGASGPSSFEASESVARRLSRAELDNTLETLLSDDSDPAHRLLSEDEFSPYDNDYTLQLASNALIESLEILAADVAARALESSAFLSTLPCEPSGPEDVACFRSIAAQLLTKGFRRAVSDEELEPYMALLDYASEQLPDRQIDFYTSVDLLIRSIVQDPEFLYRIEIGEPTGTAGIVRLDDYELATRMSYLLWGDMPDAELFLEASSGALAEGASRRASATRMLQSDRARAQLRRFHAMWLGYRAIPHTAELTQAFASETNALIDRVLFDEPQSYLSLFTASETFLDATLAAHYGLPAPDGGTGWVAYADSGRAGILSHGSVLSAFSKFSDTSPTQRGILVRTRLMCDEVPPPPPDINTDEPPSAEQATCKVDRYDQHRSNAGCATCHSALDPIGFGLENYDMAGRWRDHDDGDEACVIEGRGTVEPYGDFSGPAELAQILVDEGELDDCVVRQLLSFALGRPLDPNENALAESMLGDFRQGNHALFDVLLSYVESDAFALRLEPAAP